MTGLPVRYIPYAASVMAGKMRGGLTREQSGCGTEKTYRKAAKLNK